LITAPPVNELAQESPVRSFWRLGNISRHWFIDQNYLFLCPLQPVLDCRCCF